MFCFSSFLALNCNNYIVQESIMQLVRLDACEATVLTYVEQRAKRGAHRQKMYVDTFTSPVRRWPGIIYGMPVTSR